ncbi:MAG: toll/interleukin-1 receptor domain-containing protein [Propionibacteriaceae bacterium]|jgi:hypothetical protein|nr:toll/interleukin-1 receptor domain-containing protein [Propionibacteriaceae bacterium]
MPLINVNRPPVAIGVSWSARDETYKTLKRDLLDRVRVRLVSRVDFAFDLWDSELVPLGLDWKPAILHELDTRPYAMPLLSPGYLASPFIITEEWPRAARSTMFPVSLIPVDLTPGVLTPAVTARQIFSADGKSYSQLSGNAARDQFADDFIKAMINRLNTPTVTTP